MFYKISDNRNPQYIDISNLIYSLYSDSKVTIYDFQRRPVSTENPFPIYSSNSDLNVTKLYKNIKEYIDEYKSCNDDKSKYDLLKKIKSKIVIMNELIKAYNNISIDDIPLDTLKRHYRYKMGFIKNSSIENIEREL